MSASLWPDPASMGGAEPWVWIVALAVALALTGIAGFLVAAEVAVTRVMAVGMEATYGERAVKASPAWERVAADTTAHLNTLLFLRVVCEVCAVLAAAVGMLFLWGPGWPALVVTALVMIVVECVLIAVTPGSWAVSSPGPSPGSAPPSCIRSGSCSVRRPDCWWGRAARSPRVARAIVRGRSAARSSCASWWTWPSAER